LCVCSEDTFYFEDKPKSRRVFKIQRALCVCSEDTFYFENKPKPRRVFKVQRARNPYRQNWVH